MPSLVTECRVGAERLALERAGAFLTRIRQVAQTAPAGTVLAACG